MRFGCWVGRGFVGGGRRRLSGRRDIARWLDGWPGGACDPQRLDALFSGLEELGDIADRRVTTADVGKEFLDSGIQLGNLEKALVQFQRILTQAGTVEEMLAVEAELARIRGEIERIKGERAWLQDRVALATVSLELVADRQEAIFAARPKFHPGLRLSYLALPQPGADGAAYGGYGLSVYLARYAHLDLDLLTAPEDPLGGVQGMLLSFGADVYSDYLGRGRRRWLNPHLGLALGYAHLEQAPAFAAAGVVGVELFKSEWMQLDSELRVLGLAGEEGARLGVQPGLALNLVF